MADEGVEQTRNKIEPRAVEWVGSSSCRTSSRCVTCLMAEREGKEGGREGKLCGSENDECRGWGGEVYCGELRDHYCLLQKDQDETIQAQNERTLMMGESVVAQFG